MSKKVEGDFPPLILLEDLGMMFSTENSKKKSRYGLYKCGFCGTEAKIVMAQVKRGHTKSCGCYGKQNAKNGTNKKHNLCNTRIYGIWKAIKGRVLNPKYKTYKYYGGRGITICDEWKNDFKSFYGWAMSNGYSDELTIDRIDNDGNYEPNNCRWVTKNIQNRHKRIPKNNTSGYKGVSYSKRDGNYQTYVKIKSKKICIGYFQTAVEGVVAYNNYIIENNLEGFILNEIPQEYTKKEITNEKIN